MRPYRHLHPLHWFSHAPKDGDAGNRIRGSGWNVRRIIPRLPFFFFSFFKVEVSSGAAISLLHRDQSTLAQQAETTVDEHSLTSCMWARFPDRFPGPVPTVCLNSMVSPLRLRWVKSVCVFRCNSPPVFFFFYNFWWPGSFTCHCGNTRVERTLNKSQHRLFILEKNSFLSSFFFFFFAAPVGNRTSDPPIKSSKLYQLSNTDLKEHAFSKHVLPQKGRPAVFSQSCYPSLMKLANFV